MSAQCQQQTETFGAVSRFFSIVVFELGKELIGHNKNKGIHVQMNSFPTSHQLLAMECGGMHSHLTTKLKHDGKPKKTQK